MNRKWLGPALAVLPLAIGGGLVVANSQTKTNDERVNANQVGGYICPATGEELPCPFCCPLKKGN